ncbi:MAG: sel1 repeat family protein [Duodenibacillus sp.]|nr:sel1 repeat family protein [Duodenibacillus sp.]
MTALRTRALRAAAGLLAAGALAAPAPAAPADVLGGVFADRIGAVKDGYFKQDEERITSIAWYLDRPGLCKGSGQWSEVRGNLGPLVQFQCDLDLDSLLPAGSESAAAALLEPRSVGLQIQWRISKDGKRYAVDWIGLPAQWRFGIRNSRGYISENNKLVGIIRNRSLEDGRDAFAAELQEFFDLADKSPEQRYELGKLYMEGKDVKQDYSAARKLFEGAAEEGHAAAMLVLAAIHGQGLGVRRDGNLDWEWTRKAADKGFVPAWEHMGYLHFNGDDFAGAAEWWQKAADAGMPLAQNQLGYLYETGRGVPRDYAKAKALYEKAAAQNWRRSWGHLGDFHLNGWGGPADPARALECYRKAAELGDVKSMVALAGLYEEGRGVTQNFAEAADWLQKACEKKNKEACARAEELRRRLNPS